MAYDPTGVRAARQLKLQERQLRMQNDPGRIFLNAMAKAAPQATFNALGQLAVKSADFFSFGGREQLAGQLKDVDTRRMVAGSGRMDAKTRGRAQTLQEFAATAPGSMARSEKREELGIGRIDREKKVTTDNPYLQAEFGTTSIEDFTPSEIEVIQKRASEKKEADQKAAKESVDSFLKRLKDEMPATGGLQTQASVDKYVNEATELANSLEAKYGNKFDVSYLTRTLRGLNQTVFEKKKLDGIRNKLEEGFKIERVQGVQDPTIRSADKQNSKILERLKEKQEILNQDIIVFKNNYADLISKGFLAIDNNRIGVVANKDTSSLSARDQQRLKFAGDKSQTFLSRQKELNDQNFDLPDSLQYQLNRNAGGFPGLAIGSEAAQEFAKDVEKFALGEKFAGSDQQVMSNFIDNVGEEELMSFFKDNVPNAKGQTNEKILEFLDTQNTNLKDAVKRLISQDEELVDKAYKRFTQNVDAIIGTPKYTGEIDQDKVSKAVANPDMVNALVNRIVSESGQGIRPDELKLAYYKDPSLLRQHMASNIYQPTVPIVETPESRDERINNIINNVRSAVKDQNTPGQQIQYLQSKKIPKELHDIFLSPTAITAEQKSKLNEWEKTLPSNDPLRAGFTPIKSEFNFKLPEGKLRASGMTPEQFNKMTGDEQLIEVMKLNETN